MKNQAVQAEPRGLGENECIFMIATVGLSVDYTVARVKISISLVWPWKSWIFPLKMVILMGFTRIYTLWYIELVLMGYLMVI